jgi:hypothetical protein
MENKNNDLGLIESIKSSLRKEDQELVLRLNFTKTDDEIITDLVDANLLEFNEINNAN